MTPSNESSLTRGRYSGYVAMVQSNPSSLGLEIALLAHELFPPVKGGALSSHVTQAKHARKRLYA